ncbi:AraC family transcriptional regulator [Chryseolinea sp. H1M3-3]|uniref:AraC family transcriptional regulator n=1 Tax=Chryseolinea sp. H1M3-3 TaxID=3034144 RepID=UPI0023EB037B|nr:AraC family transcriptional regulator [Chryseolinea sp. H1M3-3]
MRNIPIRHIQATQKEQRIFESFRIRDVQNVLGGKDMTQELHRHDFFFILALRKGLGSHKIDFTPYTVADHVVFFLRPGQVHQLTLKSGSKGYLLEFNNGFFSHDKISHQLLRKSSHVNFCQPNANGFKKLDAILRNISQEYVNQQESYLDVIKANLSIFFIELLRQRKQRKRPLPDANNYAQDRLEQFFELLETHVASHKQVSQYAEMLNLSNFQLNAITKSTLGKTCSELIDEYIILESKRYLLATSNQVTQIAYHLGYEDVSYFIRFFKKHTGHSPESFRNNFR